MPRYQVRPGVRHGAFNQFGPGDVVELNEGEAAGFLDKLSPLPDADSAESHTPPDSAESSPKPRGRRRK